MDDLKNINIKICDECKSEYKAQTSEMVNCCPECSHILYGYKNCDHKFNNDRCVKCLWKGKSSEYINKLKNKTIINKQ